MRKSYYHQLPIEPLVVMGYMSSPYAANTLKYAWRMGLKNRHAIGSDCSKAIFYWQEMAKQYLDGRLVHLLPWQIEGLENCSEILRAYGEGLDVPIEKQRVKTLLLIIEDYLLASTEDFEPEKVIRAIQTFANGFAGLWG